MFDSIYTATVSPGQFFAMALAAIVSGVIFSWLISFKIRAPRRFFIVAALIPFIVATIITFVSGNIGAGVAFGGAFALTRFRSAQGSADEIAGVLIAMGAGVPFGMGYLTYGVILLLGLAVIFVLLSSLTIYTHGSFESEKLLKITIPESLEYNDVFSDIFEHYLSDSQNVGVKTTGMGSMFRLSYRIRMKDAREEKAFIDELRTRNGNLEISILPYTEEQGVL